MQPPSLIWSPFDGYWRTALTLRDWTVRFGGPIPAAVARWLVPGPRARYVPCIHAEGCRHPHRVKRARDGSFSAVPEAPACEIFEVPANDVQTLRLDLERLGRAIASVLAIEATPLDSLSGHPHVLRLGRVGKPGDPCFLVLSSSSADLSTACDIVAAHARRAIVLTPFESHAPEALRSVVRLRHGCLLALPELVGLNAGGELLLRHSLAERCDLARDVATTATPPLLGGRSRFARGNVWPHARPNDPKWSDVILTMHMQEVAIGFGASQAKFDYREIDGFTDRRGGKRPNRVWTLLRAFAMRDGTLPLPHKEDDPVRVRTLADLDQVLRRFFGIDTSAFARDRARDSVTTAFRIRLRD